ncbi:ethanolamine ammonia-lyase subunit EutC [Frisingicoccus sp.]|uniref:ethanolamine ammonia-lyase subunit EutC n=1 Tax=Frisingicoccus sp. TaxID=1918627 RepID=UPI002E782E5D|nr:ethanolamine ammonia-lyase subunit EutC [Frisingicoccus sp.]MEE0752184.1 ethanolamine ammonia-lyase subunit EutC [Frisingicoccus sp.]
MLTQSQIDAIAEAVLQSLKADPSPENTKKMQTTEAEGLEDMTSPEVRGVPLLDHIEDREGLERMMARTTARIGVGNCGPRLKTRTMLTLRADHAAARDAVFKDVGQELLDRLGLFTVETRCKSKDEFLTRPDLGRLFPEESLEMIRSKCGRDMDVQVYASDGLSSTAIEANLENILPVIMDGLKAKGLKTGAPFFVKNGRVAAMDQVSEALNATVTCVLIGERPGLATAESMSAYIAYKAVVGMPEARRTVVSNIHSKGIPAVEAGAYIVDVIQKILEAKASGVELKK